jgi:lipid-A-disaccharide synthase
MTARVPGLQILVARAPALDNSLFTPLDELRSAGTPVTVIEQATDDVLVASDAVVTASGTATVQTALHGRPMVVVYKLSPLSYAIGRSFVRVSTYAMVNLVAGRRIVPELIQRDFTPERVADEVLPLLTDRRRIEEMTRDLADVRSKLGSSGASRRAAEAVANVMTIRKGTHDDKRANVQS